MKKLFILLIVLSTSIAGAQNYKYSKKFASSIRKAIGTDIRNYQIFSYPVNNFGAGTCYTQGTPNRFICDSWYCIGIDDINVPTDIRQWLSLNSFAAIGDGGTVTLSEKVKDKFALNVMLPKIMGMLNLNFNSTKTDITDINVTITKAWKRKIRPGNYNEFLAQQPDLLPNPSAREMRVAFNNLNLIMTYEDLVIEDLIISIDVKGESINKLNAKYENEADRVIGEGELQIEFSKEVDGKYSFKSSSPLIVAVYTAKQPSGGGLTSEVSGENQIVPLTDVDFNLQSTRNLQDFKVIGFIK